MELLRDGHVVIDHGAGVVAERIGVGEGDGEAGVVDARHRVVVAPEEEGGLVVVAEDGQAGVAAVRRLRLAVRRHCLLCPVVKMEGVLDSEIAAGERLELARRAVGWIAMGSAGEEDDEQDDDMAVAGAAEGRHGQFLLWLARARPVYARLVACLLVISRLGGVRVRGLAGWVGSAGRTAP